MPICAGSWSCHARTCSWQDQSLRKQETADRMAIGSFVLKADLASRISIPTNVSSLDPELRTSDRAGTLAHAATVVAGFHDPSAFFSPTGDHADVVAPDDDGADLWP
jgi:hypothetical protein